MPQRHHIAAVTGPDNLLQAVADLASNDNVIAAAIAGGGTGYTVGDILTVSGGTVVGGYTATLEVTSVAAGVIDGIRVDDCGAYSAQPGNPVSVTGGTGSGATFNLTFETNNWTINRNINPSTSQLDVTSSIDVVNREIQFQGPGAAGADEIYFGILSFEDTDRGAFNWIISGQTGYDSGFIFEDQPGNSWDAGMRTYVPLTNGTIEAWIYVHPRYLMGVFRVGSNYMNFFAGFINTFATPTEFPYPLYISGCSTSFAALASDSGPVASGLNDPGALTASPGSVNGPACLRHTDGAWWNYYNWTFNGSSRSGSDDRIIAPGANIAPGNTAFNPEDRFGVDSQSLRWSHYWPFSGNPGTPTGLWRPTDNTANDIPHLIPTVLHNSNPTLQIWGELPDVYAVLGDYLNLVPQDRIIVNGVYYRVFQQCARSDNFALFAIREDN